MLTKHAVRFSAALLFFALGVPANAQENTNNELPPVVRTLEDLEQGRKNVKSVLRSLSEMFSAEATFPTVAAKPKKLLPAYHRIVKGDNNRSVLIYRPRFSKAERLYKALDGVVVGSVLIEQVKEENMLVLNAPDKEINTYPRSLVLETVLCFTLFRRVWTPLLRSR